MSITSLLLLADGRFPSGGHAHSGGLETAVTARRVTDIETLKAFLSGRLATVGLVSAAFAAAACHATADVFILDAGLDARTPSPALRRASRAQGRALLRAARQMWPLPPGLGASHAWPPPRADDVTARREGTRHPSRAEAGQHSPHQPVALGVVAAAAGLDPAHAALAAAYGTVTGPASAAVRLLGLDPYRVHALLAALATDCETVAAQAAAHAGSPVDDLPAASAPLLDVGAEIHARWEVRLFAS